MDSKKITKDNTKKHLINKECAKGMLKDLKDFKKFNKKYNFICHSHFVHDFYFFRKYNLSRYNEMEPFFYPLAYIMECCEKFNKNVDELDFDEVENIIKEHTDDNDEPEYAKIC